MVLVVYVHHLVHLYILSLPPQVPSPHRLNVESSSLCSTQVIINFVCIQCFCSVAKLCPTLCDPIDYSAPGFPVLYYLPKFAQTHVH